MSSQPLDPARMLATLSECGVDFVVIGALAVGVHAEVRGTGDVDVMLPIGDEANKRALERALKKLNARRLPATAGDIDPTAGDAYPTLMFSTRYGKLDVLYQPDGSDSYVAVKRRSLETSIGGRAVAVAGRDDLVRMKLAAGRPDDLSDVANLTADAHGRARRVFAAMPLARAVDEDWARDLAGVRVSLFDPAARVWTSEGLLRIEAERAGLTDAQIEQWAQSLAERLQGAEVLARAEASVEIEDA